MIWNETAPTLREVFFQETGSNDSRRFHFLRVLWRTFCAYITYKVCGSVFMSHRWVTEQFTVSEDEFTETYSYCKRCKEE